MNVIMQDGPFLVLRLYCFIGLDIFSYNLLVYTAKNVLIILLQGYRIIVLLCQCREEIEDQKQDIHASMASITYASPQRSAEVIRTRPQPYTIDKTGKLYHNPPNKSMDTSTNTLDSRDLNFVSSV